MTWVCGALWAGPVTAEDADWALRITPYLFVPGLDASMAGSTPPPGGGSPVLDVGPVDVLSRINMVAMVAVEADRGPAFLVVDWMYLDLGDVDARIREVRFDDGVVPVGAALTLGTDLSLDAFALFMGGGRRAWAGESASLDLFAGVRTFDLSDSLAWTLTGSVTSPGGSGDSFAVSGQRESHAATWDAVLGARGRVALGRDWSAHALVDLGRGDGSDSREWMAGLDWRSRSFDLGLAWRDVRWGWDDAGGGSWLRLAGPLVSASFRF